MIGAGSGFGEAEGDVDGAVEIEEFEGDEALVMIHGEDGVEISEGGFAENGVRDGGTGEAGDLLAVEGFDGGSDDALFLVAEGPVLAGVGVEAGDGDVGI